MISAHHTTRTWRIECSIAATILAIAASAPAWGAPPAATYEISGTPQVARPGGVIAFAGICWIDSDRGATQSVHVSGARRVAEGAEAPFDFYLSDVPVDRSDGSYNGRLQIPPEAPAGDYTLSGMCMTEDAIYGFGHATFRVEGDPVTTTTVATTRPPATSTTTEANEGEPAEAHPAEPQAGSPTMTG